MKAIAMDNEDKQQAYASAAKIIAPVQERASMEGKRDELLANTATERGITDRDQLSCSLSISSRCTL
jgi:hypothetical protein